MLIDANKASLLMVDLQHRLLPVMANANEVRKRCLTLLKAADRLKVPVTFSEQYPHGLGPTILPLRDQAPDAPVFAKMSFSCWKDAPLKAHLISHHEQSRPIVILAGIEAHVCVLQTALDLAAAGFGVFAVADAMSSRANYSVLLAHERMRQSGIIIVNTEMVIFELLRQAGTPDFQALAPLIR
jgi:nicotinamidase-related amidase